jgi:hypothetical protein
LTACNSSRLAALDVGNLGHSQVFVPHGNLPAITAEKQTGLLSELWMLQFLMTNADTAFGFLHATIIVAFHLVASMSFRAVCYGKVPLTLVYEQNLLEFMLHDVGSVTVIVCVVSRYQRPCYRKVGDVSTALCVRVAANRTMKVDSFYVMNVISVITSTVSILRLMPSQLAHGSASGA